MSTEQRSGYCALCISRCGCRVTVEDGRLTRVEADPSHPTGQALCVKAKAAPEAVHAPGRLLHPLRRTRPKDGGDPGWQAISWDEALDLLASKIRAAQTRHGPDGATGLALGVATPSGTAMSDSFVWVHRLAHALHSPNLVFATENCNWYKDHAPALTYGAGIGMPDYAHTGCILLWGFNPSTSWLAQATALQQARQRGAKLIVIDPRRAGLAVSADLWLRPQPGSDGALAQGLAHQLIERHGHDADFLTRWSDAPFLLDVASGRLLTAADLEADGNPEQRLIWDEQHGTAVCCPVHPPNVTPGSSSPALTGRYRVTTLNGMRECEPVFERLKRHCAAWDATTVATVTGIPEAQLQQAMDLICAHRPLSYFTWTGTCQHEEATQISRALSLFYALTGCIDAPGGNVWFDKPPLADMSGFSWVTPAERAATLGLDERPLGPSSKGWITTRDLFRCIVQEEPYPISCLLSFGSNFLSSKPHTRWSEEALAKLDFFALSELYETPTARHADLLLPACTAWEREGLQAGFQVDAAAESLLQLRPAFVSPQGESRSDTWIIFALACRLGLQEVFFNGDQEAALRAQLAPTGLTPEALRAAPGGLRLSLPPRYRKYEQQGFATPSRRLELYCPALAQHDQGALPEPSRQHRPLPEGYDLLLTTAKWPQYCHSQQRDLPSLRRRMPEPLVELHPEIARQHGITAGDWVEIHTTLGSVRARARLEPHLAENVVCAQYGWWQYADGAGDTNRILDGECFDPVSGSNALRSTPCYLRLWSGDDDRDEGSQRTGGPGKPTRLRPAAPGPA